jgi:hypothetical protein
VNPREVLAAAATLNEFTVAQLTAYCSDDESTVITVLHHHGALFRAGGAVPAGGELGVCWQVISPESLEAAIKELPGPPPHAEAPEKRQAALRKACHLDDRRLFAEEALLDCATQSEPEQRLASATLASTYLRQYVAHRRDPRPPWWEVTYHVPDQPRRVQLALVLAALIRAASGGPPPPEDVARFLADDATALSGAPQTDNATARLAELVATLGRSFLDQPSGATVWLPQQNAVDLRSVDAWINRPPASIETQEPLKSTPAP